MHKPLPVAAGAWRVELAGLSEVEVVEAARLRCEGEHPACALPSLLRQAQANGVPLRVRGDEPPLRVVVRGVAAEPAGGHFGLPLRVDHRAHGPHFDGLVADAANDLVGGDVGVALAVRVLGFGEADRHGWLLPPAGAVGVMNAV